jgi:hypothetical protein
VKNLFVFFALCSVLPFSASAVQDRFPISPNEQLTPGSLCERPDQKRYPEGIAYCARKVKGELKREVMQEYDEKLGYKTTSMQRSAFKIDHFIPLCMGGSNKPDNLWPQHVSVYNVTDPLEPLFCEKMAQGKLRQADAVGLVRRAKRNLDEVPAILDQVARL